MSNLDVFCSQHFVGGSDDAAAVSEEAPENDSAVR